MPRSGEFHDLLIPYFILIFIFLALLIIVLFLPAPMEFCCQNTSIYKGFGDVVSCRIPLCESKSLPNFGRLNNS